MKKAYLVCVSVACAFFLFMLNRTLRDAQAKVDASGGRVTNLEEAITHDIALTPAPAVAPPVTTPVPVAEPTKPVEPTPAVGAIFLTPSCADHVALQSWRDDPKKNGLGTLHPELQYGWASSARIRPCLKSLVYGDQPVRFLFDVQHQAGRRVKTYHLPYGTLTVFQK